MGNPVQVQVLLSARKLREVHRNNKAGTIQVYLKMVSVLLFCIYGDSRGTSVSEKRLYALRKELSYEKMTVYQKAEYRKMKEIERLLGKEFSPQMGLALNVERWYTFVEY